MGGIKVGDKIIVTKIIDCYIFNIDTSVIGTVQEVLFIDSILPSYPFKIIYKNKAYWAEGVLYSSLMMELL